MRTVGPFLVAILFLSFIAIAAMESGPSMAQVSPLPDPTSTPVALWTESEELYYRLLHDYCIMERGQAEALWCGNLVRYAVGNDTYRNGFYGHRIEDVWIPGRSD